jgi:mercuric ion binding protein
MKKLIAMTILILAWNAAAFAAGTQYQMQVDGLACPFCAYGIEKKLSSIKGVKDIKVDIKKGQVIVTMADGATLSENLAREKVKKAGFTLRSFAQVGGAG